jgi:hypothetical protein
MGRDLFEIAALFIGVAFAALLIGHPSGTEQVVQSITRGFGYDLATVELAGGAAGNSGIGSGYGSFSQPSMYGA